MKPEQVKTFVQNEYSQTLHIATRTNPDGYAFYLNPPRMGSNSNRIFRVVTNMPGGDSHLKLAVSNRVNGINKEIVFNGTQDDLRKLIDNEVQLYKQHFEERIQRGAGQRVGNE
jgi:hypothetical protein